MASYMTAATPANPDPIPQQQRESSITDVSETTVKVKPADGRYVAGEVIAADQAASWVSKTEPKVIITSADGGNNLYTPAETGFVMNGGKGQGNEFVIESGAPGWRVKGFSFKFKSYGNQKVTVAAGKSKKKSKSQSQTFEGTGNRMSVSGANGRAEITDLQVVMERDGQTTASLPKGSVQLQTATIADSAFTATTPWYTMQIGNNHFYIKYNGWEYMTPDSRITTLTDADLWTFTGDAENGYTIYNRRTGTKRMLAAPKEMKGTTGSESYPVMKKPGDEAYNYKWDVTVSEDLDVPAVYISEHGEPSMKINNRDGRLAFWTGGADANSSVQLLVSEVMMEMNMSTGKITGRSGSSAKEWVSNSTDPELIFGSDTGELGRSDDNITIYGNPGTTYTFRLEGVRKDMEVRRVEFDVTYEGGYNDVRITTGGNTYKCGLTRHVTANFKDGEASITISGHVESRRPIILSNVKVYSWYVAPDLLGHEVMTSGTEDIPYRIPAIATVGAGPHKGRLIAVADYRYTRGDIGIGKGAIDLRVSYSDDNGKTWSEPRPMMDKRGRTVSRGNAEDGTFDNAYGDPAIIADRESGRVLIMSCAGSAGFWGGRRDKPQEVAQWWSEDGGETWTRAHNATEDIYKLFDGTTPWGYIDSMFFGSGRIMQSRYVKKGDTYRLYAVLSGYIAEVGADPKNWVLYSDDFGKTWSILGDPMDPPVATKADEPKAEELPDGSVLLAGRGFRGGRNYNIYTYESPEEATGKWGTVFNTQLNNPNLINACNGEILILPVKNTTTGQEAYMAIQTYPFGPGRKNVGLSWKILDEKKDFADPESFGSDWEGRYQLSELESCYTTLTLQKDNTIGFLYEEDRYGCPGGYCIVYQNLSVDDLTDGKWTATTDNDNKIAKAVSGR